MGSFPFEALFEKPDVVAEGWEDLELDGFFKLETYVPFSSSLKQVLKIDPIRVINAFRVEARKKGQDFESYVQEAYGLKKIGRKTLYFIPKAFQPFVKDLKREYGLITISQVPKDLTRATFGELSGHFNYKDIMNLGFIPMDHGVLLRQFNRLDPDQQREIGVFKHGKKYVVELPLFLVFAYAVKRNLTYEQALAVCIKHGAKLDP